MIHIFLAYDENFFSAYTAGRASLRACPPTRSVEKYRNNNCADDKRRVSRCKILLRKGYAILNKKKKKEKTKKWTKDDGTKANVRESSLIIIHWGNPFKCKAT